MSDYGYLNARLRGMKTRLLGRPAVESLAAAESPAQLISELLATVYKTDLEWGRLREPGVAGFEEGLRRHIVGTVKTVAKCAQSNPEASAILGVLVARWDVHNLRTLLRGLHVNAPPHEVRESLLPVGQLDESQLAELASQSSTKALIDLLVMWGSPYARPLTDGYPQYAKNHDLSALELKLDQFHYHYLSELTRRLPPVPYWVLAIVRRRPLVKPVSKGRTFNVRLVREIVVREIDVINIVTLLRLSREGLAAEECRGYFIPGGKVITADRFAALAGRDVDTLVAGLAKTPYGEQLRVALPRYHESGAVSVLERRLEEYLVTRAISLFKGDLLSSAVLIAYLYAKFNELTNLRLLARGKESRIPDSKLREALIIV